MSSRMWSVSSLDDFERRTNQRRARDGTRHAGRCNVTLSRRDIDETVTSGGSRCLRSRVKRLIMKPSRREKAKEIQVRVSGKGKRERERPPSRSRSRISKVSRGKMGPTLRYGRASFKGGGSRYSPVVGRRVSGEATDTGARYAYTTHDKYRDTCRYKCRDQ